MLFNFLIEIPLGDARLLEEHELTNVLNQLPEELAEEAFNELFTGELWFSFSSIYQIAAAILWHSKAKFVLHKFRLDF